MTKYCCPDFKNALAYEKSTLCPAGRQSYLLQVGFNKVSYQKAARLAKLILTKRQLSNMPKHGPNEIIRVPVFLPIRHCPFCGKLIKK